MSIWPETRPRAVRRQVALDGEKSASDGVGPEGRTAGSRPRADRSAGKQRRRSQIIEAAAAILEEEGESGLNMRRVAERAGLSYATPYNLFGSKEAIIGAVFSEDFALRFEGRFRALSHSDPLMTLFDMIDLAFGAFQERPTFYQAVFETLGSSRDVDFSSNGWLRGDYMESVIRAAMEDGRLHNDHAQLVIETTLGIFRFFLFEWVAGRRSLGETHSAVGLSVALFLGASTPPEGQRALHALRERYAARRRPG